jgi:acyl-CoA reductase-like NAD-dependent aldehyde dehydrogenase
MVVAVGSEAAGQRVVAMLAQHGCSVKLVRNGNDLFTITLAVCKKDLAKKHAIIGLTSVQHVITPGMLAIIGQPARS